MWEADDSLISSNENGTMSEIFMKTRKMSQKNTKMEQNEIHLMRKKVHSLSALSQEDYSQNPKLWKTVESLLWEVVTLESHLLKLCCQSVISSLQTLLSSPQEDYLIIITKTLLII